MTGKDKGPWTRGDLWKGVGSCSPVDSLLFVGSLLSWSEECNVPLSKLSTLLKSLVRLCLLCSPGEYCVYVLTHALAAISQERLGRYVSHASSHPLTA